MLCLDYNLFVQWPQFWILVQSASSQARNAIQNERLGYRAHRELSHQAITHVCQLK